MQEYQRRTQAPHRLARDLPRILKFAAEVTITAAEKTGVDAAASAFADLLLPLEPMGLPFEFQAGEGPVVHHPVRTADDVIALRIDRADELGYVARAIEKVAMHFSPIAWASLDFAGGAPFTLASYMIEGGGSRNYVIFTPKKCDVRQRHCVEACFWTSW